MRFDYTVVAIADAGRCLITYKTCANEIQAANQTADQFPESNVIAVFSGHHTELTGRARVVKSLPAESADIGGYFKREWPCSYLSDPLRCLKWIYQIPNYESALTNEQRNILRDLEISIQSGQEAADSLFDFRRWNLKRIAERNQRTIEPRIALVMRITEKGNFYLRWRPVGEFCYSLDGPPINETDFDDYTNQRLDQLFYTERPHNELMFIHAVWVLKRYENRPAEFIDQCLLLALKSQVDQWVSWLHRRCELTLVNDIDFQFRDERLIKWTICDVEERWAEQEKSWIENFESTWRMPPSKFVEFYHAAKGWDKCEGMNRLLKKAGYKFALKDVRAAIDRITRHHGHLLSEPPSPA